MPRHRTWSTKLISDSFGVSGTQIIEDLLVISPINPVQTVARIVVHLGLFLTDIVSVVDGTVEVDLGIGVASEEAFLAGVVPDPNVESETPARGWLWRDRLWISYGAVADRDRYWAGEVRADLRAMRKVDRGILYMVSQVSTVSGTFDPVTMIGLVRSMILV